jgi:hypothetical protein
MSSARQMTQTRRDRRASACASQRSFGQTGAIRSGSSSQREDRNGTSLDRTNTAPGTKTSQPSTGTVPRVVFDTDTLVAAAYAEQSASRHVLEACLRGEAQAIVSPALQKEYAYILKRAVRGCDFSDTFRRFLEKAEVVEPLETVTTPRRQRKGIGERTANEKPVVSPVHCGTRADHGLLR